MTKTIFIVDAVDDIEKLKTTISKYPDSRIFSLNYFAHNVLTKNSIKHEIGENYLTHNDKNIIDKKTVETTSKWYTYENIEKNLNFDGINLANIIEMELFDYISKAYKTGLTIIRIIENEKPQTVVDITNFHDLIKKICEIDEINLIIPIEIRKSSSYFDKVNIKYNIGSLPFSVTISKEQYKKIKNMFDKVTKLFLKLNKKYDQKKKSILLLDFNPIQYGLLLSELSKLDKNILLLNQRRPAVWNLQSFQLVRNSRCKVVNLTDFRKKIESIIQKEKQNKLSELNAMWKLNSIFEEIFNINNYSIWYSIKDSFTNVCNTRFLESIERILLLKQFFNNFTISVVLEWAETAQHEKEVIHVAKKYGIKTVMLQHGIFPSSEPWDLAGRFFSFFSYPLISDKQAVWGEFTKNYAISHGHDHNNLMVTGSTRHDKFFHAKIVSKKGIIVLATTGISEFFAQTSTTTDYLKFNNFVREVCRVVQSLPNKKLVVKPHPQPDFVNNIIDLIKEINPNIQIILDVDLIELINSCELLITFNNSTIALESIILNKPTISLQIEKWAEESEIAKMNAVLSITKEQDIEDGIQKMLNDNELKNKIGLNGKKFLELYMSNKGYASQTLAKILDNF